MDQGVPRKMQGAQFTVRGSRAKKNFWQWLMSASGRCAEGQRRSRPRIARVGRCSGGSRLQSARRLVNGGRSVKAAVLAAQSLTQVGDLEAQAQVVCELAREQQATMLATLADGDERGF